MKLWRGQDENSHLKPSFTPRDRAVALLAFGGLSLLMAWLKWHQPKAPPFTGRWAWVESWAWQALGPQGLTYLYLLLGAGMVIAGALTYRKND